MQKSQFLRNIWLFNWIQRPLTQVSFILRSAKYILLELFIIYNSCKIFVYNRGYDKAELSNEIIPVEFGEVKQEEVDGNHR